MEFQPSSAHTAVNGWKDDDSTCRKVNQGLGLPRVIDANFTSHTFLRHINEISTYLTQQNIDSLTSWQEIGPAILELELMASMMNPAGMGCK